MSEMEEENFNQKKATVKALRKGCLIKEQQNGEGGCRVGSSVSGVSSGGRQGPDRGMWHIMGRNLDFFSQQQWEGSKGGLRERMA